MNSLRLNTYAKLNLTLDITGREGNFHTLDSLVTTIDIFDKIIIKKRKDSKISVQMHGLGSETISPENNNAVRAGEAFISTFDTTGADVTIYKNIPIGAGLGGSSSDAAGVINGLAKLYKINDFNKIKDVADRVGSDTGYLLKGGFCRMQGRGEKIEFLDFFHKLYFLLLIPKNGVSTAECYKKYDTLERNSAQNTQKVIDFLQKGNIKNAAEAFSNDLFLASDQLNSDVGKALEEIKKFSPLGATMTGSGSAVFALFETEELCEWAASRYRGKFRCMITQSFSCGEEKSRVRNPFILDEIN